MSDKIIEANVYKNSFSRSDVFQMILVEVGFSIIDVALSEISVDEFREIMHISVAIISSRAKEWHPFISQFIRQVILKKLHGLYHLFHKQVCIKFTDSNIIEIIVWPFRSVQIIHSLLFSKEMQIYLWIQILKYLKLCWRV